MNWTRRASARHRSQQESKVHIKHNQHHVHADNLTTMPFVPEFFQNPTSIDKLSLARLLHGEAKTPASVKAWESTPSRISYTQQLEPTAYSNTNPNVSATRSSYEARRLRLLRQSNWAGVTKQTRLLPAPETPEPEVYDLAKRRMQMALHNSKTVIETRRPATAGRLDKNTSIQIGSRKYHWSPSNLTVRTRPDTSSSPYTVRHGQMPSPKRYSPISIRISTPRRRLPSYSQYQQPSSNSRRRLEEHVPLQVIQSSPLSFHQPVPQPILSKLDDFLSANRDISSSPVPSPVPSPAGTTDTKSFDWNDLFDWDGLSMICEADETEISPSVGHETQTTWSLRGLATSESEAPTCSRHGGVGEESSTAKPPPGTPRVPHDCISGPAQPAITWNTTMAGAVLMRAERSAESESTTTDRAVGAEEGRLTDAHLASGPERDLPTETEASNTSTLRLPKPFVGRLAGQHIPDDQAIDARPARGRGSKKQYAAGKINIRSLPNFDGDPIEEVLS